MAAFRSGLGSLLLRRTSRFRNSDRYSHGSLTLLAGDEGSALPLLPRRGISSPFPCNGSASVDSEEPESATLDDVDGGDLRDRIFNVRSPRRSASIVIEKWIGEGRSAEKSDLWEIAKQLGKCRRYKHALEVLEWIEHHHEDQLSPEDCANRIDLITKVHGIDTSERFFDSLPATLKTCASYTAMLHSYASAKLLKKAETLFEKMKNSSLTLNALPYNEMMTLYMSMGLYEKIPPLVEELRGERVSPDLFTYNLWISACAAMVDVDGIKDVLDTIRSDSKYDDAWRTYVTLIEIYIDVTRLDSTQNWVVETEKRNSQREQITYDLLILLYAGLGNNEMITQIWKSLKMTLPKMTSRNYLCILSSLIMLGRTKDADHVLEELKQAMVPYHDVALLNRLLDAFVKAGLDEQAGVLQHMLSEKRLQPRYKITSVES